MAKKKPALQLVADPPVKSINPPRTLAEPGRSLWNRVMTEYDIRDSGGVEMLALACQALDRAESLREQIDADGEVLRGPRGTIKDHPALKHELASRAFVARTLMKLGLNFEPVRSAAGRPGQSFSWTTG
jgi:P27 family predicted phage terminase small subunit